jgi:hypothetical protein
MRKARALTADQYSSRSDPGATRATTQWTPRLFSPDSAKGIADVEQKLSEKLLADFLPKEQAAAELHVCERTLDRWHALGMGPPRAHVGRKVLYRRASVQKWLCAQERQGRTS